ncbi:hypothetical protein LTR62_000772 [Meristemomyces frigidus]|uniref:Serine-threonine kinase receptor-associated protein n=1 Tax=Meristemomyces frigidus TaxID=1508187 RepID=A0AAN7YQR5_9PEZI|nr:hypothetical protein LTR62_000772 [Meristemomyces frigidus]
MDFAFKRQDETAISETTKIVPLTCHGHSRPITHLSFSSLLPTASTPSVSGNPTTSQFYIISACKDNNPMLRDGLTGDWIGTFIGHKGAVWSARLSEDATLAATGSADFSAKVWDTFTGECLFTLQHEHIVRAVAFPPAERPSIVATGGMEKRLRIWDISGQEAANGTNGTISTTPFYEIGPTIHQGPIKSIVWTRDPNILVTAADDKIIRWWELRTRTCIAQYPIASLPTSCELNTGLDSSPAGILSVAAGKDIYFFHGSTPATLLKHITSPREIASVALEGGRRRFVTGSPGDTWVRVWSWDDERELEVGRGHHGPVWTVGWSPDAGVYATGSEDGTVKMWKAEAGGYGLWR